jgi:hypothetical protein
MPMLESPGFLGQIWFIFAIPSIIVGLYAILFTILAYTKMVYIREAYK